jgi:hypothetical protein
MSSPRRTRSRAAVYAAIVIVIAVVLVILVATNILPLFPSSKSTATALSYSGAHPIADQSVSAYQGGGWALVVAAGLDSATSVSIPVNSSESSSGECNLTLASGVSGSVSISAFTGSLTAGVAPAWEFLYRNGAGSIAVVTVIDGSATVIGTLAGATCSSVFGLFHAIPSSAIDSSAAAGAVSTDAAAFLAQYPNASAEFGLTGGISLFGKGVGAEWGVVYKTCPISATASGTGTEFNATVNATDGSVVFFQTTSDVSCKSIGVIEAVPHTTLRPASELAVAVRSRPE